MRFVLLLFCNWGIQGRSVLDKKQGQMTDEKASLGQIFELSVPLQRERKP